MTIYDANETMKLIGFQNMKTIMELALDDFKNMAKARDGKFDYDVAFDAFLLGIIYGKRMERSKRSKLESPEK